MNLIIVSHLSTDPPSEGLYFRHVTMMAKTMGYDIALEAEQEMKDYYYHFLKKRGWFDFVDDFVTPERREEGVRIDTQLNYPLTIQVKYIKCENTINILGQLDHLSKIS